MTLRAKLDVSHSLRTQSGKVACMSLLAVTRSTPLFVPYQGVIR
jgi:hypothetical protein